MLGSRSRTLLWLGGRNVIWWAGQMPTVLRERGYRLFFYADDKTEPRHVHVQRERAQQNFGSSQLSVNGAGDSAEVN